MTSQRQPAKRRLPLYKVILFSVTPAILFLTSAEVSLRLAGLPAEKYLQQRFRFPPPELMGKAFASDTRRFWRLVPGYDGPWTMHKLRYNCELGDSNIDEAARDAAYPDKAYFDAVTWEVNEYGSRGPQPDHDRKTMLFVGSSVTFGWAVTAADAFSGVVRQQLRLRGYDDWCVVNAGVPGYSSFQIRQYLNDLCARLNPRIVIIEAGLNDGTWAATAADADLADAPRSELMSALFQHSNLLMWLHFLVRKERRAAQRDTSSGPPFYASALYVPGRSRVSPQEFGANLIAMATLVEKAGGRAYFIIPALFNEHGKKQIRKSAAWSDPREIDLVGPLSRMPPDVVSAYLLPYDEGHLSPFGHRFAAAMIWQRLCNDGLFRSNARKTDREQ